MQFLSLSEQLTRIWQCLLHHSVLFLVFTFHCFLFHYAFFSYFLSNPPFKARAITDPGFVYFTSNLPAFNKFKGLVSHILISGKTCKTETKEKLRSPELWAPGASSVSMPSSRSDVVILSLNSILFLRISFFYDRSSTNFI